MTSWSQRGAAWSYRRSLKKKLWRGPPTEQETLTARQHPGTSLGGCGAKGRARKAIHKGQYVCEYRNHRVYPVGSAEEAQLAAKYGRNREGSSIPYTAYPVPGFGTRLCFDATRRFKDLGCLINHADETCCT